MKNSKMIISLSIFLLCTSVFCAGNFDQLPSQQQKKGGKPAYVLTVKWPYAKDYSGTKYTKSDFPTFDSDNFAIDQFHPITDSHGACYPNQCPNTPPFNFNKIQDCDSKYLSKYIENFEKNKHATTEHLWDNSCSKKNQTQYFADLVKAHQKFNIIKALKAKGIVPSKTQAYKAEQLSEALSGLLGGKKPTYYCASPIQTPENDNFTLTLRYIHILLDENLNAANEQYTLCTYEYCGYFYIPPIEF